MEVDKIVKIELAGMRFFGIYGLYELESLWTTELIIDMSIHFKLKHSDEIQLEDTIDYQKLYNEIQQELENKHKLLETIACNSIERIKKMDSRILSCRVKIYKSPQLGGPLLSVAIEMEF